LLPEVWRAAEILSKQGIELSIVNLPWLNQVDYDWLRGVVARTRAIFTLDNHLVKSGQGRMIAAAVAGLQLQPAPSVASFGLTDFPACGQNDEVLRAHGLDAESLATAFIKILERK
jgi:transketolase